MNEVSTCVNCLDDYSTDEMFWVDWDEGGNLQGFYCYECDANLIRGDH